MENQQTIEVRKIFLDLLHVDDSKNKPPMLIGIQFTIEDNGYKVIKIDDFHKKVIEYFDVDYSLVREVETKFNDCFATENKSHCIDDIFIVEDGTIDMSQIF